MMRTLTEANDTKNLQMPSIARNFLRGKKCRRGLYAKFLLIMQCKKKVKHDDFCMANLIILCSRCLLKLLVMVTNVIENKC